MLTTLFLIRRRKNPLALALLTALMLVGCVPFHQVPVSAQPTGPEPMDCAKYSAAAAGWNLVDAYVREQLERARLNACASPAAAGIGSTPVSNEGPRLQAPAPGDGGTAAPPSGPGTPPSPAPSMPGEPLPMPPEDTSRNARRAQRRVDNRDTPTAHTGYIFSRLRPHRGSSYERG
jgi:hypothetical protein